MADDLNGIDLDQIEDIGKDLQERQREKPQEEMPTDTVFETWDNEHFRERVREILLSGKLMDIDISKIQIPAQGLAKYQFRRTREDTIRIGEDEQHYSIEVPDELKKSIRANGVLDPIVVQRVVELAGECFYIINGHSRFFLWRELTAEVPDLPKPTFLVLDCPDTVAMQLAAELNRNGQNLNSEDAAVLIIRLYEQGKMKQTDIATMMNISKSHVSEVISAFHDVPPEARALIESGAWTVRHGRELARLVKSPDEQLRIMKQAISTKYTASLMEERVDSALAKQKWQKEAEKMLRTADIQTDVEGEEIRTLTSGQVEKIHKQVIKDTTQAKPAYQGADHRVVKLGKGEYEPTVAATTKLLKSQGYEVVPGEAPAEKQSVEKPKMPSNDELMREDEWHPGVCPICGGRTHSVVREEIPFKTLQHYSSSRGRGLAHQYCVLSQDIEAHRKEVKRLEEQLAKDDITLMIKAGDSLEKINNRSHQLYKDELERRKQEWREKNLPDAAKKAASKKAPPEKKTNLFDLVEQVRKADPTLVPEQYWDAYLKYQKQEEGWESLPSVAKSLGLKSHGSVLKQFQKIGDAIQGVSA